MANSRAGLDGAIGLETLYYEIEESIVDITQALYIWFAQFPKRTWVINQQPSSSEALLLGVGNPRLLGAQSRHPLHPL